MCELAKASSAIGRSNFFVQFLSQIQDLCDNFPSRRIEAATRATAVGRRGREHAQRGFRATRHASLAQRRFFGSYSVSCWYGPFPIAPLIQFGGSSLSPQASRARGPPKKFWRVFCGRAREAVGL